MYEAARVMLQIFVVDKRLLELKCDNVELNCHYQVAKIASLRTHHAFSNRIKDAQ